MKKFMGAVIISFVSGAACMAGFTVVEAIVDKLDERKFKTSKEEKEV